jgi:hypothetical protein
MKIRNNLLVFKTNGCFYYQREYPPNIERGREITPDSGVISLL